MATQSPTPRRVQKPRWIDARLVAGVLLVLISIGVGARVVSSADSTVRMWAAARSLAAGSVLGGGDLTAVRVRLPDGASSYYRATARVEGQVLSRDVAAGELLPRGSVGPALATTTVTVPLKAGEAPKLSRGERLQLWISTKTCPAEVVLGDVTVQDVQTTGGGIAADGGQNAVIRVPASLAQRVVTALGIADATLRAGVLTGPGVPGSNDSLPDLRACGAPSS